MLAGLSVFYREPSIIQHVTESTLLHYGGLLVRVSHVLPCDYIVPSIAPPFRDVFRGTVILQAF